MKQLPSLDLHFLLKELEDLKDSRINKIYQPEKNLLIFSLYKTNSGKKLLKIIIGQILFLDEEKEDYETLNFGMFLRKHLYGYFLDDIEQIEPERILKLSFKVKNDIKTLYLEFFGKGNAILCDENGIIINSLEHHEFKDRTIKPKIKYKYPIRIAKENVGNKDILKLIKQKKIKKLICGHIHEAGNKACSLKGKLIKQNIFSEELFLNSGEAEKGYATIVNFKDNLAKYKKVKV